jgi:hypothetical protein
MQSKIVQIEQRSNMRISEMTLIIKAPREVVVKEIADYTRTRILSKSRYVKSVEVLEDDGTTSIAVWRIKALWFVFQAKNRQIVTLPDKQTNEVLTGMAKGTFETVTYSETSEGTKIAYRLELRVPWYYKKFEIPLAWYSKRMARNLLMDDKRDIEAKYGDTKS